MLRTSKLNISINTDNKEVPLYAQVTSKVKDMIRTGILKPGEVLPGSREMALNLNVSRKTTLRAFEELVVEGWLEIKDRVGVFVADNLVTNPEGKRIEIAETHSLILEVDDGLPDTKLLPYADYSRLYRQAFIRAAKWQQCSIVEPQGSENLRRVLSASMCHERGVNINNDEMMISRGSQQAIFIIAHTLLKPGDTIIMENPCYQRACDTFEEAGIKVVKIEVDEEGINIDRLRPVLEVVNAKAIYLTPRYQYPTVVTLSAIRRRRLVEMIKKYNMLLIEDDFGSMFKYRGAHLLPFSHYLDKEHFVYVGTFSKIFAPVVRIGYVASCEENIKKMVKYREMLDITGDRIIEKALYDLIESGVLRRHMRHANKIYSERLDRLCSLIDKELKGKIIYKKPNGGLSIWLKVVKRTTKKQLDEELLSRGIKLPLFELANGNVGIRIGFASLSDNNIDYLINMLKSVL